MERARGRLSNGDSERLAWALRVNREVMSGEMVGDAAATRKSQGSE